MRSSEGAKDTASGAHTGPEREARVRSLLERPFQVVAGKGGVGRTVVASALALRSADAGARTLLLEVNAPDAVAAHLGVPPAVDEPREVLPNLWLCRMTPQGSLREYALMILKFKALYALVFENRLVKYLLRSIPSLAEVTMLGKTWYHTTEQRPDGSPRFERVVVDAPATGHAITFLSVARTVAEIAPAGVMKDASEKMAALVESATQSCLHVVALPEEMPVNEGLDLVRAAGKQLGMTLGLGLVNRMLPPLLAAGETGVLDRLEGSGDAELAAYVGAARRRLDREAWQADYARRFAEESRLPVVQLPELGPGPLDRARLLEIASHFDRAAGTPRAVVGASPRRAGAGGGHG